MVTRLISFLKQRDIDACMERVQIPVRDWADAWSAGEKPTLLCEAATDPSVKHSGGQWRMRKQADGNSLWYYLSAHLERQIEALLFQHEEIAFTADRYGKTHLADGIAQDAIEDLVSVLLSNLQLRCSSTPEAVEPPPSWMYASSNGAALLCVRIGTEVMSILLPGTTFSRQRPTKVAARGGLVPLATALEGVPMRMMVELSSVEMTIASWTSLALGDVIQLPLGTDNALTVLAEGDRIVCAANLGILDGHRAIEVVKAITH
jgi:hypothetical protein